MFRRKFSSRTAAGKVQPQTAGKHGVQQLLRLDGQEDENRAGGRLLQGFEEGVRGRHGQAVGGHDHGHLPLRLGGLEVDGVNQLADLVHADLPGLHFRADPLHVRVIGMVNLAAGQAVVAGIAAGAEAGLLAVQRLGQGARHAFQLVEVVAGEEVGVRQPSALQTALKQRDGLLLGRKVHKRHAGIRL